MRPLHDFDDWAEEYAEEYASLLQPSLSDILEGIMQAARAAIVCAPIVYVIASICVHGRW